MGEYGSSSQGMRPMPADDYPGRYERGHPRDRRPVFPYAAPFQPMTPERRGAVQMTLLKHRPPAPAIIGAHLGHPAQMAGSSRYDRNGEVVRKPVSRTGLRGA